MLRPYRGRRPVVAGSAYIDQSAQVIGDVEIGERVSVWPNVTIRADLAPVRIGDETNIQDNSALHEDFDAPLTIGERVVVGHSCTISRHAATERCTPLAFGKSCTQIGMSGPRAAA